MQRRQGSAAGALLLAALSIALALHEAVAAPPPAPGTSGNAMDIVQHAVRHWTVRSRLRQAAFCQTMYPEANISNVEAIVVKTSAADSPTFYIYAKGDPVSDSLRAGWGWETHETQQLLWAMRQRVPVQEQGDGAKVVMGRGPDLFLDIGTHIGWFTVNVAVSGFRVASFDAMLFNRRLLRHTLCNNSQLLERVTLYPVGLGERSGKCFIVSAEDNKGDGILDCESPDAAAAEKLLPKGYTIRGESEIERLDRVLPLQDVKAIKMDIEGFELMALRGGSELFRTRKVYFMMLEFNSIWVRNRLKGGQPKEMLQYVASLGFKISPKSFTGPFVNEASEAQLDMLVEVGQSTLNLFCANSLLFEHDPEFKASASWFGTAADIRAMFKPASA